MPRSRSRRRAATGPRRRCKSPSARRSSGACWMCSSRHASLVGRHCGSSHPTGDLSWNATEGVPYSDDTTIGTEGLPAASDLMAALALAKLYPADSPEGRMLDERIRTTLSLLIAAQHDGAWSIDGRHEHGRDHRPGPLVAGACRQGRVRRAARGSRFQPCAAPRHAPAATRKATWRPRPSCCMPWPSAVRATSPWPTICCATASCSRRWAGPTWPWPCCKWTARKRRPTS